VVSGEHSIDRITKSEERNKPKDKLIIALLVFLMEISKKNTGALCLAALAIMAALLSSCCHADAGSFGMLTSVEL
jgi:hypothetical protein